MDNEKYKQYLKSEKWKAIARRRMEIDNFECQGCGCRGTSTNMLEIHHLSYKHIYNEDIYTDLVSVCHNCHKTIHAVMDRVTDASGRHGWRDNTGIPRISVLTLSGTELLNK